MRILDLPTAHIYWLRIITFCRLHRRVAQEELDLFQFASGGAAQSGTGPPKVVRRQVVHARLSGELLNDVPGKLLGHAFAPSLARAADATEDLSRFDCRSVDPRAEFAINPVRHRDSPYVAAFAAQVYDRPMSLPLLELIDCQLCDFVTPQSTRKQQG